MRAVPLGWHAETQDLGGTKLHVSRSSSFPGARVVVLEGAARFPDAMIRASRDAAQRIIAEWWPHHETETVTLGPWVHVRVVELAMGFVPKVAATKEEREYYRALRDVLPQQVPQGWTALFSEIRRINDYTEPGVFSQIYRGGGLRLAFQSGATGLRIFFVHEHDADLLARHIQRVKTSFWPGEEAVVAKETAKLAVVTLRAA